MKLPRVMAVGLWLASVLAASIPAAASAQLVTLKTVPVATQDQFLLFPSANRGMGGVSIALDDPFLDPFVNPAKGSLIRGSQMFVTPSFYDVSDDGGAGRALPITVTAGGSNWFGGGLVSLQQIETARTPFQPVFFEPGGAELLSERSNSNIYADLFVGTRIPGANATLGASVLWADFNAMQGVDLLYAGSESIEQDGHLLDLRAGVYGQLDGGRNYEMLLLYNNLDMRHRVTYPEWVSPEPLPNDTNVPIDPTPQQRVEKNLDRTNTYGVHLGYDQPLAAAGWRVGGILTGNWKMHPKIPNYDIMNIPRDPGDSFGMDVGLGLSRTMDATTFGIDFILEPIWSDTWAEAAEPVPTVDGDTIPEGGRTVENEFTFMNAIVRAGFGYRIDRVGLQLGLQVRSIDYELRQVDHVQDSKRRQDEGWLEWTPTWGVTVELASGVQLYYQGRVTAGTGQPGTAWGPAAQDRFAAMADAGAADFIVAPSGPLTLQEANVGAHQLAVMIPIR
ncbi:MAG: hypothetical protein GWN32_18250 [Gemmatimonadetes bacterium]|nr:hypothetical protein [Gemmatimonadota bacterium]